MKRRKRLRAEAARKEAREAWRARISQRFSMRDSYPE